MKTWRERIVEAEERKRRGKKDVFTDEDVDLAQSAYTCAWAELNKRYGLGLRVLRTYELFQNNAVEDVGERFATAVTFQNPKRAAQLLDKIEDMALDMKRKRGSKNAR